MAPRLGRPLSVDRSATERAVTLAAVFGVFVVVVVAPLAGVLAELRWSSLGVLAAVRPWALLARSIALASAVTVSAIALGVPLGAVFARARLPGRRLLFGLHAFPLFLPPFFGALGWFHLFGARGFFGGPTSAAVLFGPAGAWAVLAIAFAPIVTGLTALGIRGLDASLEEAARIVAPPKHVLARILVPAARPQIALAALLVFSLSFGELGVPMFLRVDVYPAAVFARLGGLDAAPGEALALSLPLVATAVALTLLERRALGPSASVIPLRPPPRAPLELGPAPALAAAVAALVGVAPLAALAVAARPALGETLGWAGSSIVNGLVASLGAAAIAAMVGVVAGHDRVRRGGLVGTIVDVGFLLAFFLPAAVLGLGVTAVWNRPATAFVYASAAVLVLGFVGRYGMLAARAFAASTAQTSTSFEEAAAVAGASWLRRLARIVVPQQSRGLLAAFGLTLVFSLRDLETAVLFYPPGGEPLPVRIFTLEANGPPRVVAGLAVLHALVTALVLSVLVHLFERSRR